jgi:hypothetical protein
VAKKKAKVATRNKPQQEQIEKDDGTRWIVWNLDTDRPAYLSKGGVVRGQAERLAKGLVAPAAIREVTNA